MAAYIVLYHDEDSNVISHVADVTTPVESIVSMLTYLADECWEGGRVEHLIKGTDLDKVNRHVLLGSLQRMGRVLQVYVADMISFVIIKTS